MAKQSGLGVGLLRMMTMNRLSSSLKINKGGDSKTSTEGLSANHSNFRVPSFIRCRVLNNHQFEVDGVQYEFFDGQYFKREDILPNGSSFGEVAL